MTEEEGKDSKRNNTGGGAGVDGNVDTSGGDFVGRDQIIIGGQKTSLDDLTIEVKFRLHKIREVSNISSPRLRLNPSVRGRKNYYQVIYFQAQSLLVDLDKYLSGIETGGDKSFEGVALDFLIFSLSERVPKLGLLKSTKESIINLKKIIGKISEIDFTDLKESIDKHIADFPSLLLVDKSKFSPNIKLFADFKSIRYETIKQIDEALDEL